MELAKREKAVEEVRWMQDVLKRQLEEEARWVDPDPHVDNHYMTVLSHQVSMDWTLCRDINNRYPYLGTYTILVKISQ